ncbi:MAG: Holliday junction resolvase RuvX [Tissierellales bacterium]|jgi:putative Holliday junction resolvase|nr:Holliday junction resolvase RuvX [Tissierellales bacterium]
MIRYIGLDVGNRTIGVAISDLLGMTAQGITTIKRKSWDKDFQALREIIEEYGVQKAVVGLPKNMNNTLGPQGEKTIKFAEKFEKVFGLEIIYQDERMTSIAAERTLISADVSRKKRKEVIDKLAAVHILQTFLDRQS